MGIEVKVRAIAIYSRQRDRYSVAKMLFLIMILPAKVRSDKDGANPMGPYLMDTCRIFMMATNKRVFRLSTFLLVGIRYTNE